MTKDDVIILPGNVLSRQKRSPQFWACPKNRKKLRGNTRACQARRLAKACQVELMAFVIRGYVHSAHLLAHGHDAAPWICSGDADESFRVGKRQRNEQNSVHQAEDGSVGTDAEGECKEDRKSTRLNSSHRCISYAVFCLKKKKNNKNASQ